MMTMSQEMETYRTADQATTASMLAKLREVRAGIKRGRGPASIHEQEGVVTGHDEDMSAMDESEEDEDEEEELEVGSDRQPHSDEEDDGGRPLDLRRNSEESSEEGEDEEDEDAFFRPIKQGEHGQHCHVTLILYVMYTVPCTT